MQKNIYLFLFFILAGLVSNAQISKGSILLGGAVEFNSQKTTYMASPTNAFTSSAVSLSPSIGKAVKDNFIIGIDLSYGHAQSDNQAACGTENIKIDSYGLGFFLRQYFPLGKGFSLFTQEELGGSHSQTKENGIVTTKSTMLSMTFFPGIAYAVSHRLQFELGLVNFFFFDYSHNKSGDDVTGYKSNTFSAGTGLTNNLQNMDIGCKFLLGH